MRASMKCLCKSVGRGGRWPFLCRSWGPSMRTNQPGKRSAIGITGSHGAVFSEAGQLIGQRIYQAHMPRRQERSQPTWTDVTAELAGFDRLALLGLIQDLYAVHKDNQTFLHTRFGLGGDIL